MGEIIERYKVNISDFDGYPYRVLWCHYHDKAHVIAELASDDMRKVLRLLNRRAEIIKAQRNRIDILQYDKITLKIKLDMANANANEFEAEAAKQRATIAELRDQLAIAQLDNDMMEARLEAANDNVEELEAELAERDVQLSNKARWAAAWKKAAKTYWWCSKLEAELETCQDDLRRAQLEVAELRADTVTVPFVCWIDDERTV